MFHTRNRTNNKDGGVCIWIRNRSSFRVTTNLINNQCKIFKSVSVEIQYPHRELVIRYKYRSPHAPPTAT